MHQSIIKCPHRNGREKGHEIISLSFFSMELFTFPSNVGEWDDHMLLQF